MSAGRIIARARTRPKLTSLSKINYTRRFCEAPAVARIKSEEEDVSDFLRLCSDDEVVFKKVMGRMNVESQKDMIQSIRLEMYQETCQSSVSMQQYFRLGLMHGVPMVGFGFTDNFILLLVGDYLDATICLQFGLSTLFAAALGNTISNVAGLTTGGLIEKAGAALGLPHHGLKPAQLKTFTSLYFKYTGMTIGVCFGCVMGMAPLYFPKEWRLWKSRDEKSTDEVQADSLLLI